MPDEVQIRKNTEDIANLKVDMAGIKHDLASLNKVIEKIDQTMDKISEVSVNLNKILAVHDSRLNSQEQVNTSIIRLIETLKESREEDRLRNYERIQVQKDEIEEATAKTSSVLNERLTNLEHWRSKAMGIALAAGAASSVILQIVLKLF